MPTILYVDDEEDLQELAKIFLEKNTGFAVSTLSSAQDALSFLADNPVDAIISDYMMPEMNGIEFLKAVRARGDKTPFIIFTGKGREEVVIQALNCGADFYLQKGGEPKAQFAELAHKVRHAVSHMKDEIALQKNQIQLANAMSLAQIVNWEFDVNSGLFSFDERFCTLYGTAIEQEGTNFIPVEGYIREFVHPDDIPFVTNAIKDTLSTTDPDYSLQLEHRLIRRDGQVRHIIVRIAVIMNAAGRVVKTYGANQDITEQKHAEEALRIVQEKYTKAFLSAPDAITISELESGKFIEINDAASNLFGYTRDELIGKSALELGIWVNKENRDNFIDQIKKQGRVVQFELLERRKSGELYHALITGDTIHIGTVRYLIAITRDFTRRKLMEDALRESEEKFRNLAESSPFAIAIYLDDYWVYINPAGESISGYAAEEMYTMHYWDLVAPEFQQYVKESSRKRLSHEFVPKSYDLKIITKDGTEKWVTLSGTTTTFRGKPAGLITVIDITERKQGEDALRQANKKINLLSSITRHDILNQLMVLKGYLAISEEFIDKPERLAEFIKKENQAAKTIEDQIRFTKDYQDLGLKAPAWQNVNDSVEKALKRLPIRNIRIDINCTNLEIFTDPLFEKVFYNLIDNALKHGGDQMTTIRVFSQESENGFTIICEDDGVGIIEDDKQHLFTKGFGKNSGLGLFLCREILSITGITIIENGTSGKGARFEITVPKGAYRFAGGKQ